MYISSDIQLHGEPSFHHPSPILPLPPTSRAVPLFAHQSFTVHRSLEKRQNNAKHTKKNSDDKQNITQTTRGITNHFTSSFQIFSREFHWLRPGWSGEGGGGGGGHPGLSVTTTACCGRKMPFHVPSTQFHLPAATERCAVSPREREEGSASRRKLRVRRLKKYIY